MSEDNMEFTAPTPETIEAIKANIEVVKSVFSQLDIELDLNEESIKWIAGYINRNRESITEDTKEKFIDIFGSFLGEAIIKNYGGRWELKEGVVGIQLGNIWALPFSKTAKHIFDGPVDSIYSFYTVLPVLLAGGK